MSYIDATFIVTQAVRVNVKELARRVDKLNCDNMFNAGCSVSGNAPAVRFLSTGAVPQYFYNTMKNDVLLYTRAKAVWEADGDVFPHTQLQVTNALANCDITDMTKIVIVDGIQKTLPESWQEALTRVGLKIISAPVTL